MRERERKQTAKRGDSRRRNKGFTLSLVSRDPLQLHLSSAAPSWLVKSSPGILQSLHDLQGIAHGIPVPRSLTHARSLIQSFPHTHTHPFPRSRASPTRGAAHSHSTFASCVSDASPSLSSLPSLIATIAFFFFIFFFLNLRSLLLAAAARAASLTRYRVQPPDARRRR